MCWTPRYANKHKTNK